MKVNLPKAVEEQLSQPDMSQVPIEAYVEIPNTSDVEITETCGPERGTRLTPEQWSKEYKFQQDNPPIPGDYLRTRDGSKVKLEIVLKDGEEPFIFGRAYIPTTVGELPSWYVQGENERSCYGWKCILLPKSRYMVANKGGLVKTGESHNFFVKELRVAKRAENGSALMVEVSEW